MNRLKNMRCYLGGAMDRVVDGGETWRRNIRATLSGLGIVWLDPTRKPINIGIGIEDSESRKLRHRYKMDGNFQYVANEMKPIRQVDLRMVDVSDFLIVNIDLDVHATGTYEELFLANRQRKPIIIHVEQGKKHTPDWLFATIEHEMIFGTWNEVLGYLNNIKAAPVIQTFNRWRFFDFTGDES